MSIAVSHYQYQLLYVRISFQPLCNHLRASVSKTISSLQQTSERERFVLKNLRNQLNTHETNYVHHTHEAQYTGKMALLD